MYVYMHTWIWVSMESRIGWWIHLLELQVVMMCYVDAKNQTRILCKSSVLPWAPRHLSSLLHRLLIAYMQSHSDFCLWKILFLCLYYLCEKVSEFGEDAFFFFLSKFYQTIITLSTSFTFTFHVRWSSQAPCVFLSLHTVLSQFKAVVSKCSPVPSYPHTLSVLTRLILLN